MANIKFYEKTGCVNNTKQKEILTLAGHNVNAIDLIKHNWTKDELLSFFNAMPVGKWFNLNAPKVTSGEVNPEDFNAESAIDAMLNDHLLIKRPLIEIDNEKIVGFNKDKLEKLIGLTNKTAPKIDSLLAQDLETCPQKAKNTSCD